MQLGISYGGQKFATFRGYERGAQPVRTDVTLTFRELELADRHTLYGANVEKDKTKNEVSAENRENYDRMKGYMNN